MSAWFCLGPDQRITSGPAAKAAASRWRQASRRKQAEYMTAPERFAEKSDSLLHRGRRPYMTHSVISHSLFAVLHNIVPRYIRGRLRNRKPERLDGLEIDHRFKLGRRLNL